jgi:hypothetical protein
MALRIVRGPGGGAPVDAKFPVATGVSFNIGDPVALDISEGYKVKKSVEYILGIALTNVSSGSPAEAEVQLITPETVVEITEKISGATAPFQAGTPIAVTAAGVPDRGTPSDDASLYLITRVTVQNVERSTTNERIVSYLAIPFGNKHGFNGAVA